MLTCYGWVVAGVMYLYMVRNGVLNISIFLAMYENL